ncbi:MAG: hypothetical protein VX610_01160 [SAR324 cluster bacterium]|nr:hypothetical protein [SAR324 cluster bacterium]
MTPDSILTKLPEAPALPEWTPPPLGCFTGLAVLALVFWVLVF